LFRRPQTQTRSDSDSHVAATARRSDFGLVTFPPTAYHVRIFTASHAYTGTVCGACRLSDLLNAERTLRIIDAYAQPVTAGPGAARILPEVAIDPYDVEVAMTRPLPDEPWVRARRLRKQAFRVAIDAGAYRVEGFAHVFPGAEPTAIARHASGVFVPVTDPVVRRHGRLVSDRHVDTVLVNRHLIRSVALLDNSGAMDLTAAYLARQSIA
jgi:hypothetical protein